MHLVADPTVYLGKVRIVAVELLLCLGKLNNLFITPVASHKTVFLRELARPQREFIIPRNKRDQFTHNFWDRVLMAVLTFHRVFSLGVGVVQEIGLVIRIHIRLYEMAGTTGGGIRLKVSQRTVHTPHPYDGYRHWYDDNHQLPLF